MLKTHLLISRAVNYSKRNPNVFMDIIVMINRWKTKTVMLKEEGRIWLRQNRPFLYY